LGQSTSEPCRKAKTAKIEAVICLLILGGILVAGLWPFHSPKNEVAWLGKENGLVFGDYGTVLSLGIFGVTGAQEGAPCSLEIWLEPGLTYDTNTFLAFYTPQNPLRFSMHQSNQDLSVETVWRIGPNQTAASRVYVDGIFRKGKPVFVTIASGKQGTDFYVDGRRVQKSRQFHLSAANFTGRLILANSPVANDSWSGVLRGLAIYHRELTPAQVEQDYHNWTVTGCPAVAGDEGTIARYVFSEHSGTIIHNQVSAGIDLTIPAKYMVLHQILLDPLWKEFNLSWGYWKNVLINIGGFIPLGFFFCAYLTSARPIKRAALATIILGGIISLIIEILQAYLPTRDSGMTDVITNTLGTAIGVMLYRSKLAQTLYDRVLSCIPFGALG